MPIGEQVVEDYRTLRLSLKTHPLALLRGELDRRKVIPTERLGAYTHSSFIALARRRPKNHWRTRSFSRIGSMARIGLILS